MDEVAAYCDKEEDACAKTGNCDQLRACIVKCVVPPIIQSVATARTIDTSETTFALQICSRLFSYIVESGPLFTSTPVLRDRHPLRAVSFDMADDMIAPDGLHPTCGGHDLIA